MVAFENISIEATKQVRQRFLKYASENASEFEECDVKKVETDEWAVKRFVWDRNGDEDAAFEMLKKAMKWRKETGVNHIKASDMPLEFFHIGELFVYEEDKDGVITGYVRGRLHKKFSDFQDIENKYVLHFFEEMERRAKGGRWNFVWDCDKSTLFNLNVEIITFFVTTLINYYPLGTQKIIVHQLPMILWAVYQMARGFFPEHYTEVLKFSNKTTLVEMIGAEHLPNCYEGGFGNKPFRGPARTPEKCTTLLGYAKQNGISEDSFRKFMAHYQKHIDAE